MKSYFELLQEFDDLSHDMDGLITTGKTRALHTDEREKFDRLEREMNVIKEQLPAAEAREKAAKNRARVAIEQGKGLNSYYADDDDETTETKFFDFQIKKEVPINRQRPITDFVQRNFDVDEKMLKADVFAVIAGLCGKKYPANSPINYALEASRKSLTSSALLNPYLSAQLIDGGLSKSRLAQAGMRTFAMLEGQHKFARIATYPSLTWEQELASTTERTVVFDNVSFAAKTLRGWVTIGGETLMDSLNIEQSLRTVFSKALGNGVDTAGLYGTGSGDDMPLGIANYVGIPTLPWNDTLDDYDWLAGIQKEVHDEDGPDLTASIMSPDAYSQLLRMKGTNEKNPIEPPWLFKGHRFFQTSKSVQTTGTGTQSEIVCGGFDSLNLGIRLQAEIIITPVAAETYSYNMLAVFRGDFQPNRVEDFGLVTGVDAAPALT